MNRKRRREIFEAVGLIAIVASLVFLALETRQNTNALYAESRQSVLTAAQTELFVLVENPDIVLTVLKDDPLTEEDQVKVGAWLAAAMRAREYSWLQHRDGIIDEAQWETEVAIILWILDTARTRDWWEKRGRFGSSAGFAEFVDSAIQNQPATVDGWRGETNWAIH
jgi:hypothetical protein